MALARCWIAKVAEPLAWYCPYLHLAASCNTVCSWQNPRRHFTLIVAQQLTAAFSNVQKILNAFWGGGKDLANHASILLGAHQRVRALQSSTCQDLPRLPKTCLVSIPSVGIYRHLSAAVLQDLGGNVLYLARLSARCNGSWTWALSSGPEIWGSISSVMRCYEMFLEYIVVVISKKTSDSS